MYRQYEDPRALEKELESLRAEKEDIEYRIESGREWENHIEYLQEELFNINEQISELEQRVNFAWQDEEFG